jgi:pimeloyl-ACP methyl ester carboxylesterase
MFLRAIRLAAAVAFLASIGGCGDDDVAPASRDKGHHADAGTRDSGAPDASNAIADDDAGRAEKASGKISSTKIKVGDLVFDALVAGPASGEPVILLHGFPETSYEWRSELAALGDAGYRAVAPDQRGYSHGARPTAVQDYRLDLIVKDLFGMADALGFKRFHLVGHDWGASVVWLAAVLTPERLQTINPISIPHPDAFAKVLADKNSCQYAASAYIDVLTAPDAASSLLGVLDQAYAGLPDATIAHYKMVFATAADLDPPLDWYRANVANRMPLVASIGRIKVPTMFIWSDGDAAVCKDGPAITGDYVDAPYRFEIIKDVSHWVPELGSDRVNELLLDHLREFPIRSGSRNPSH